VKEEDRHPRQLSLPRPPTICTVSEPRRNRPGSSTTSKGARPKRRPANTDRGSSTAASEVERLEAENAALHAEVERLRELYKRPIEQPSRAKKAPAEPEPERLALVGPGECRPERRGPSDEALDSVGEMLCRLLEERQPGTSWRYYRNERLVPDGVTFFFAHEALRRMWGNTPGNVDPSTPHAFRRLTATEQEERKAVLGAALARVDDALERSQSLHGQGHAVAAFGLLKYVDLLLARFNLALAQSRAGHTEWQSTLNDPERDAKFEAWLAKDVPA